MKNIKLLSLIGSLIISSFLYANQNIASGDLLASKPSIAPLGHVEEAPIQWSQENLFVFPEAGRKPWIDAINYAVANKAKRLLMSAYKLSDPIIVNELIKASKSINIDLLIEPVQYKHDQSDNVDNPIELLKKHNIHVYTLNTNANPDKQAHHKLLIVELPEHSFMLVGTGNLDKESFDGIPQKGVAACRDFILTSANQEIVNDAIRVFNADIKGELATPTNLNLIWGPDHQREKYLAIFNTLKQGDTLYIYNQDFQDKEIADAVAQASQRGVRVEIMMMEFPFNPTKNNSAQNQAMLTKAGAHVYYNKKFYIHAKIVAVKSSDPSRNLMVVGSCNFYPPSLDHNRELALVTHNQSLIDEMVETFNEDIRHSDLLRLS